MAFVHHQIVVASSDGTDKIAVSDRWRQTQSSNVWKFLNTPTWADGGVFGLHHNMGKLMAMVPIPQIKQTPNGQGDLLLMGDGDAYFTGGIAAFLVTQVCYIVAFTRIPGPGLVRAWRIALVPYAVIWIVLNLLVSPGVGDMRIPVLLYSVVLISMAVAALDLVIRVPQRLGWRIAAGALLFVASDAVIALTAFGPLSSSPALTGLIMATYVAAQALIVTGMAGSVLALRSAATR